MFWRANQNSTRGGHTRPIRKSRSDDINQTLVKLNETKQHNLIMVEIKYLNNFELSIACELKSSNIDIAAICEIWLSQPIPYKSLNIEGHYI